MQTARKQRDDHDALPPDLAALKRACDARGIPIQLPRFDGEWELPEPIPLPEGVLLSDIVIRNRGKEP